MTSPLAAAVIRDGNRAILVIVGKDIRRLPAISEHVPLQAERLDKSIILRPAATGDWSLEVDLEAELDLRSVRQIRLAHASRDGLAPLGGEASITWPASPRPVRQAC